LTRPPKRPPATERVLGSWDEALARAAALLDPSDPLAQVFFEEREDLRLDIDSAGRERATRTRWVGASARRGGAGSHLAHVHDPSPDDLLILARGAVPETASRGTPTRSVGGARPEPIIDDRGLRELARRLVGTALECAEPGERVEVGAECVSVEQRVRIARPGRDVTGDHRAAARVRLDARVERGGVSGIARADVVLRGGRPGDPASIGRQVVERARERTDTTRLPRGERRAVLAPGVGGVLLHEIVGHALEGDTVLGGRSLLASRADRVAAPGVRIIDDPRRGRGAWRVDDEGEEARPALLIDDGRVTGALHDLSSAAGLSVRSTSHARRSAYHEDVRPRMGCTFLAAGSDRADDLISDTPGGLYIRRLESAVVDPIAGTATFVVSDADEITAGRLGRPLVPLVIAVDTVTTLLSIDRIADDLAFDTCVGACLREGQPLVTSVGAPTFRIGLIRVMS